MQPKSNHRTAFLLWHIKFKKCDVSTKLLCEEAKIKQYTFLKKELSEIGEEAVWESRFTWFFFFCIRKISRRDPGPEKIFSAFFSAWNTSEHL